MSDARLPAGLEAAAIRRAVEATGGFAAIVHKGDANRGILLLVVRERGAYVTVIERGVEIGQQDYAWRRCGPAEPGDEAALREFLAKRLRFDTDSWIIDLDVPDGERFVVEMLATG